VRLRHHSVTFQSLYSHFCCLVFTLLYVNTQRNSKKKYFLSFCVPVHEFHKVLIFMHEIHLLSCVGRRLPFHVVSYSRFFFCTSVFFFFVVLFVL
jgi:hypothetical protein